MITSSLFLRRLVCVVSLMIGLGLSFGQGTAATSAPLLTYELRPTAAAPLRWHGPDGLRVVLGATSAPATLRYDPTSKELWLTSTGLLDVKGLTAPGSAVLRAPIIRLHDSPTAAIQVDATGSLTLHAETIDLFALQHPTSWLRSGGDMILRSPNPIWGDAHYSTGGDFRLEDENGRPADLFSPHDPIVLASGNVSFGAYTGASLHVVAGGRINVTGNITINGTDTAANTIHPANVTLFNASDPILRLAVIPLSNGQTITVRGNLRPTLDLRAGIDWTTFTGGAPVNGVIGAGIAPTYAAATTADITTQAITISDLNGLVVLTNQYRPNAALTGNISTGAISTTGTSIGFWGGDVTLNSKGNLTTGNIGTGVNSPDFADDGGDVRLLAEGNVVTGGIGTGSQVSTVNSVASNGGAIVVQAGGSINTGAINTRATSTGTASTLGDSGDVTLMAETGNITFTSLTAVMEANVPFTGGDGGDVIIQAPNGSITTASSGVSTRNFCNHINCQIGSGGHVLFEAGTAINLPATFTINTASETLGQSNGRGGNISIHTDQGNLQFGTLTTQNIAGAGDVISAGQVHLSTGQGSVRFSSLGGFARTPSGHITTDTGGLLITATTGITTTGAVNTFAQNNGTGTLFTSQNSGDVHLFTSNGPIFINGVINASNDSDFGSGRAGNVTLTAPNGPAQVSGNISTNANAPTAAGAAGSSGHVTITAGGNVQTNSIDTSGSVGAGGTLDPTGDIRLTSTSGNVAVNFLETGLAGGGPYTTNKMGDIAILAPNGSISVSSGNMYTRNECTGSPACDVGQSGDIFISAGTGLNFPANFTLASTTNSSGRLSGRSGDITVLTEQGNIVIQSGTIWTRNEATLGSVFRAGHVTLATGQGAVRINTSEGYARTPDGDVLEDNGNLVITATTGITITGTVQRYVQTEATNTPYTTQSTGSVSLYTSNGPILITGAINTFADGDAASSNSGQKVTLTAPNGSIQVNNNIVTNANAPNAGGQAGPSGDVTLTAGGNIQVASIDTSGALGTGGTLSQTGDIALTSTGGNIIFSTLDTGINSNLPITSGKMGDIAILAPTGSVTILGNSLYTRNECLSGAACDVGQGGDMFISASTGINFPANIIIASTSNSVGRVHGRSGDITFLTAQGNIALQAGTIWVRNEATLGSVFRAGHVTLATGQGAVRINNLEGYARTPDGDVLEDNGNLIITATTGITVTGSIQTYVQNEASNTPFTTQKAGDVSFYTSNGPILVTGSINASADADASGVTGGDVTLTAPNGALTVSGTTLTNINAPTAAGQAGLGGHVTFAAGGNIQAGTIDTAGTVGNGGTIGRTGNITLTSTNGNIILSNGDALPNVSSGGATFNGSGDILLHAPNGSVTVTSTTLRTAIFTTNAASHATADAGNLTILASTGVSLPPNLNLETMINVGGTSTGRGGDVTIITGQGNILFNHIWANTTTGQGGAFPGSGSVHLETGNGSVQLTDGSWGVTNYAVTTSNGQTTAATGSVHITATTGITIAGPIQNYAQLGGGGTGTVGTGDISLYTSNGPIQVNGNVRTDANGRTTTGPTGDITLQAPNGAITIGGTTAPDANASDVGGQAAESGHITLLARDNIQTNNLDTGGNGIGAGGSVGRTGSIFAESELGNITVNLLSTDIGAIATHAGTGDIHLRALNGQININNSTIASRVFNTNALASNTADAGDVILEAGTGINFPPNTTIITMVNVGGTSTGRGGDVRLTTGQGNISFAFIWANTTSTQGGTIPGSGSVHLETGNGSVQLTDGLWGVTNYAVTTSNGQTTAATGSVHITATTGITLAGPIQNFAQLGGGGTGTAGTGDVSLYTSNGPIRVNGNVRTDANGRTTTGPTGDITLQAPNGAITIGGTTALDASASEVGGQAAESGHITLLARDNIQTGNLDTGGNSIGVGGSVGRTGSIFAESQLGNITVTNIWTDLGSIATHAGTGDIHLRALNGQVTFLAFDLRTIVANTNPAASNTADAGDVIIEAGTGIIFPPGLTIQTMVNVGGTSTGRGGDVRLTTAQGDINFGFLWANTTTGQGGNIPGSGSVHLETGNGSVQLTDGTWGVTNYAFTTSNGQTTAATGSVHITATTGITIGGNVQNYVSLGGGGTNSVGTGAVSLYTSNGPIYVNASINNQVLGRTTSAPSGGITLTAPNGSITVNGSANTSTHAGDANGQAGTAAPITLTADSHISTGGLNSSGSTGANGTHAGGGNITLASDNGNITFNNFLNTGFNTGNAITTGPAGNVSITAPNGQVASNITTLTTLNATLNGASTAGRGGDVTMQSGTGFNWLANFAIRTESYSNGQVSGRGGNVSLQTSQGNISMGNIWTHSHAQVGNSQAGGNITLSTNDGAIQLSSGLVLVTYSRAVAGHATASAGNITLNATQGISVLDNIIGFTLANGTATYGGDVQMNTSNGNITVGSIDTSLTAGSTGWSAGDITLNAPNGTITANNTLFTNASTAANTPVQAGHIALTSSGDIQTQTIIANAPNGPAQQGGTIELTSDQMVRTLGNITADGVASAITITHGGGGVIPFIVGDATTNGSTGALTTADAQIVPTNSYLYTHHEAPNIWIISVDGPNLALSKQVSPALIDVGGTVTYTVVLTNSGPTAANGLLLTDVLPPEVVFGSWLAQPAGAVQAGQNITWTGNLAASTAVTLQFTAVHVGTYSEVVTNTANYYLTAQPSLNGTANATFTVSGPPNVSLGKSVSATSPALPGQPISYTISVANESATAVARNVIVTDTIPAQLLGASVSASGLTILNTTGSYVWELADLAPNQSGTIVVSGFINPAVSADVTFTNTVTLSAEGDPDPTDNSASVALTVQLPRVQLGTAATAVGEPNSPALLNVTLDRAHPYRPVTVTATTSDGTANAGSDYTPITQTVVFAPNQTTAVVAIPILDDTVQEGSEAFSLTLSAPAGAILAAPTSATITIVDNDDTTGVLITPALLAVAEGGATDSYEVRLGSAPTDTVTITLAPDGQLTTSAAVLTFTAASWSDPQVVTVTAVDDAISEGNHLGFVQHTVASNDPAYNGLVAATVIAAIADNETAGIVLTPLTGNVAEGGATASYTITLQAEPTAPVTITIAPDGQVTTSVSELVFTATNWATPQLVTVTAVDDTLAEGNHVGFVGHSVASGDPNYEAAPLGAFIANIADNDGATVSVAPTNLALAEGGVSASYAISLTSEPTAAVYVNISPDGQLTTDMAVLTFTAANWDVAQMVTVSAVDDALVEGAHSGLISHSTSSADDNYNGLLISGATVGIADNDLSYSITAELSLVLEGDLGDSTPITFTVQRSGGVTGTASTVDFALTGTATAGVDYGSVLPAGGQLSFAAGETSQQIILLVVGDDVDEVEESLIATLSNPTAAGTAVLAADTATTLIVDDEGTPSLNLLAPATVDEDAGSVTFTVTLSHASGQTVTVAVATSDGTATAGADYAPLTQTVTIPAGQTAVTLTVAIVDDGDVEPDETFHMTFSNPQNGQLGGLAQAMVTIVDNDVPPAIPTIYLPLIMTAPDPTVRPDLVVSSVVVSGNDLEIVITNVGGAAVTTSFWVDAFIGPDTPPTAVNQSVEELGGTNIAWGIATSLAPGASLTLRIGDANQAPQYTTHSGPIPAAVPVYVHVDAFSEGSSVGAVLEQHELDGTPYNNISGPFSH